MSVCLSVCLAKQFLSGPLLICDTFLIELWAVVVRDIDWLRNARIKWEGEIISIMEKTVFISEIHQDLILQQGQRENF